MRSSPTASNSFKPATTTDDEGIGLTICASAAGPAEARAYLEESTARGPRHMAPTAASAG
jgi:hypothetical protein